MHSLIHGAPGTQKKHAVFTGMTQWRLFMKHMLHTVFHPLATYMQISTDVFYRETHFTLHL